MSDKFSRISIERLLKWVLEEEKHDQIFGIHKDLFFVPTHEDVFKIIRYGQMLETPIGVAAGPHSQLAQNIVMSWLTGARYIELKTVQTLDEIEVSKPCIDMEDEGYNCEWSQELLLADSFDEYLNAWIIIHILKDKFEWGNQHESGFIFNASIGYDMAGILKPNVQHFLDKMVNCKLELEAKIEVLSSFYPRIKNIRIPDQISNNITLSTMHGCPTDEIEKICRYFIKERKFHTTLKLNPTLLGAERVREILNDKLGFEVQVPDEAFEHDLKYPEALELFKSLKVEAKKHGVEFGLKLTNTLEVRNNKNILPDSEENLYLSGRALHPISINLADKLQTDFEGQLDISFCAGVDCFNVSEVLACGIEPVTTCTDLLKPGGYTRLKQYLTEIEKNIKSSGSESIAEFILARNGHSNEITQAGRENLHQYASTVLENRTYHKSTFPYDNIKTRRTLMAFDCIKAPCVDTCAIDQDIPQYLYHAACGDYQKAFEVILKTNPLPNVTGLVCDHLCQMKCTRINYDNPLLIREIKRFITEKFQSNIALESTRNNGLSVGIIGAGPSGLTCAYFLALEGFDVHVYENESFAGGMVVSMIPSFRMQEDSVKKDIDGITALGVNIHYNTTIDAFRFNNIRDQHDYVYIAIGAQASKKLGIPGENAMGVLDQLTFLAAINEGQHVKLGQKIAVIGGGNSAVDVARTANRLKGKQGEVTIIYRRTRKEMPANSDDIQDLLEEGVQILELVIPDVINTTNGIVTSLICSRMVLGEKDESGRPRSEKIPSSEFELDFDTVISAIGQNVVLDFIDRENLRIDLLSKETQLDGVFAGGDFVRGASSVINAMGDGQKVAENIIKRARQEHKISHIPLDKGLKPEDYQKKQAQRQYGVSTPQIGLENRYNFDLVNLPLDEESAQKEAARCLYCDDVCNICVSVCPNYANIAYTIKPMEFKIQEVTRTGSGFQIENTGTFQVEQTHQILNIADFCNECGNCTTFCPTSGDPFKDKPRFFLTEASFKQTKNGYYLRGNTLQAKKNGELETLTVNGNLLSFESDALMAKLERSTLKIREIQFKSDKIKEVNLGHMVEMNFLLESLKDFYLFG
ncbi:MAG: putative selenate reductase subunit YgfK [Candidatus Marinimicrobia bacterium]|nr:putative selenate reductase subunit YgfK [Candidatus Neomarinimicrobiota bacterium]